MADPIEIARDPTPPMLPGRRLLRETHDDVIDAVCADLYLQAGGCVREFGDVHLAFEPAAGVLDVLMRLMVDPLYRSLPWASAHVWVMSDGPHAPSDGRSGFSEIAGIVGDHAGIPAGQLHAIPIGQARPDEAYEAELHRCLSHREGGHRRLDFVLGALGEDGGFGGVVASDGRAMTAIAEGPRVSLTLEAVNSARCVGVVASGAAGALSRVAAGEGLASMLAPRAGELRWYLDHPACGGADAGGRGGENPGS